MFTPAPGSSVIGLNNSYFNRLAEADRYYAGSADESSGSESAPGLFRTPSRPGVAADVSFGSALGLGAKASPDGSTPPVPETHKFVGTVDYVAPESILGLGGDDAAVDWVSLTFVFCLCHVFAPADEHVSVFVWTVGSWRHYV
jgi:serine/threonine-protein kinase RIM15